MIHEDIPKIIEPNSSNILLEENGDSLSLNDYNLQDLIGTGSYSKVYRVKKKQNNQIYAAKISTQKLEEESEDLYMDISREVNIISKLNHPSILEFILYSPYNFKNKPKPVIITEYASNGSLSQLIEHDRNNPKNRILDDTRKLIIIYGIASAMSFLHLHKIIHRDLKPDNILLDDFLNPKIADFGISKKKHTNTESMTIQSEQGTLKGTMIYLSPEIWENQKYSKSSDVYAFSIVVYEIMTCQQPYPNMNKFSLMSAIKAIKRPEFTVSVPEIYKSLIQRCWSQDPKKRPSFDQILIELKTNKNYITEKVNKNEFLNYIKFIDDYKISFDSEKVVILSYPFIKQKFNWKNNRIQPDKNENKLINTINNFISKKSILPYKYYNCLSKESILIVKKAEKGDSEKQFEVARNLIEGRFDFPIDVKIGIDFIKKSINNGNKNSLIYFIQMLIKGNLIPRNHKKAQKLIESNFLKEESVYRFLYGKLCKNEKRYQEAMDYFLQSLKIGNNDSGYEIAELLRKNYCQQENQEEEISKYYKESIDHGNYKAMFKYGIYLLNKNENDEGEQLIKQSVDKGCLKAIYYYGLKIEKEEKGKKKNRREYFEYYKRGANEGHAQSMNKYALKYIKMLRKSPKEENKEESLRYLKKASDKGFIESMYEYGSIIVEGDVGIQSNPKEGARYVKIAAENGCADAMGCYASLLKYGKGVDVDYEEAVKYYKTAIDKGSKLAMNNYAFMLQNGQGVEVNYKEAIKYYKMAIDKGYSKAMSNYARMLEIGQGVDINYKEAIKYYKMAIDKGNTKAMNNYALMLKNGHGVNVNYKKAVKYFKMAIDKGNPKAMNNYAIILKNGKKGIKQNISESIKYFKMAIEKGYSDAMNNYACMLRSGKEVDVNYNEAIKYFKMAIENGHIKSMNNLAQMYKNGEGSEVDYNESIKYYRMAIEKGNSDAMNSLAQMYRNGEGVEVNYNESIKYYRMAIEKGNSDAMNSIAQMYRNGEGVEVNYNESINYFKMAIDKGNSVSMTNYANILWNGEGIDINKEEAVKYYKMAIERNNLDAMLKYGLILIEENETENNKEEGLKYIKKAADEGNADAVYQYDKIIKEEELICLSNEKI